LAFTWSGLLVSELASPSRMKDISERCEICEISCAGTISSS